MNKKIIIIITAILILIIVGVFAVAYIVSRDKGITTQEVLRDFVPFGGSSSGVTEDPRTPNQQEPDDFVSDNFDVDKDGVVIIPRLRQLSSLPISGAISFIDEGDVEKVRYVDRATGNVFEVNPEELGAVRITNTTIPAVQRVLWSSDGNSLVLQYLDEDINIKSFSAEIVSPEEEGGIGKLEGSFLEDNLLELTISPDGKELFYIIDFGTLSIGTISDIKGKNKKQIFEHSLKEWNVEWGEDSVLSLTTKPSGVAKGYTFLLNKNGGSLEPIIGNLFGITTKYSNNSKKVILSDIFNKSLRTRMYNLEIGEFSLFPITTFPEKCVWSIKSSNVIYCGAPETLPIGVYPDNWYMGVISLSDNIWRIDIETGFVSFIISPNNNINVEIDLINPLLSKNEEYLFFTNKKDSTLWSLRLSK